MEVCRSVPVRSRITRDFCAANGSGEDSISSQLEITSAISRTTPRFIAGNTQIGGTDADPEFAFHRRVTSYITLDMQLSYEFVKPDFEATPVYAKDSKESKNVMPTATDSSGGSFWQRLLWGTTLTVGVNNVFDRNPPSVLAAPNDNYDTSLYSIRNRYYYVAFTKKF